MAAQWVPASRPIGPPLRVSVPVLVFGVIAAVIAFVGLGDALAHAVSDAPVLTSPGTTAVQCRPGSYVLYVESGSPPLSTSPGAVVVRGPGGLNVTLELQARSESVTRGGQRFSGDVGFNASVSGRYAVTVHESGVTLLVAPAFTTIARDNLGWVILLLAGVIAVLAGLVLLIVGAVRRSRAKRQAAFYGSGPYGGGPAAPWPSPGGPWPGPPPPPGPFGTSPAWPPPGDRGWASQPGWSPPPPGEPREPPDDWPKPSQPSE